MLGCVNKTIVTVNFNDISYSGYGVGMTDSGEAVYAWNAFPSERAEVELFSKKREPFKGTAVKTLKASEHRIDPLEDYFLISAPWQVIDYEYEVELKEKMFAKIWREQVGQELKIDFFIANPDKAWHYRNTMEFNVVDSDQGLDLALMARGRRRLIPIKESHLVYPVVNQTVNEVLGVLSNLPRHSFSKVVKKLGSKDIKQIIVRANNLDETMVGVYDFGNELIYSSGPEFLEEKIGGVRLRFSLSYFWQPNISVFGQALAEIEKHSQDELVVDMYSGVGAIGLSLAEQAQRVWLVEQSPSASKQAQENIKLNNIKNAHVVNLPAEQALEYLTSEKTVIFDPPRVGLDDKIIKKILKAKPVKIIYLSCKPYTQCLDIKNLLTDYNISHVSLYNFFPRTPHLESLIILERK